MKKLFLHPRIEIIFSLSLIAILGLPPLVLAQTQKSIEIKILNGDTTINGKDIKKLSPEERKDALSEMNKMGNIDFKSTDKGGNRDIVIRRNQRMKGDKNQDVVIERRMDGGIDMPFSAEMGDSIRKKFTFRLKKVPGADSTFAFKFDNGGGNFRFDDERAFDFNDGPPMPMERQFRFDGPGRGGRMMGFNRKNTQTFNYSNTDNDGISTDVSFRVNDASKETAKRIAGTEKTALDINDLNLSPEFSTGKTTISFNLEAKTSADVKLTDSEGKALWSDKAAGGSFSKKINLPRNGIYILTVKQGANVAVKRIVKE
ncbi:T9SS type A sorting domain-containing protein [Mucilaginibacter sp. ZT4R22]|uniref:T9SS type A sorting domain-containing protein n=1 Tax=Mucilaginibacter pankratovii TaxID=2772110 RepID=A0ABR7WTH8_9SPHI|nr:T9SS type A sorting domain-containing protein [Mucilaginibacter pankratovii]MBD1365556.1 T9SS type A sorting domain-containing protein [Mucilaginibacter pankratovii]